jgi:hypothetical protein
LFLAEFLHPFSYVLPDKLGQDGLLESEEQQRQR